MPERVRSAIAEIQAGRKLATTVADGTGNIWLVRRVSQTHARLRRDRHRPRQRVRRCAVADIRQRVDDVLSDAAATLERLDVARALNDAKMRSETELLREALIGSVSHELRTPLTTILGAATVLRKAPVIARRRAAELARRRGARRGRASQQRHPEPARCDAHQPPAGQAAAGMDRARGYRQFRAGAPPAAARRAISISLDMDSNLPFIYVDPVLVEQAFVQIVDNAAKYSPAGSTIDVSAKRNGHDVVLTVQRQGRRPDGGGEGAARRAVLPRRPPRCRPPPARASACGSPRRSSPPTAASCRP